MGVVFYIIESKFSNLFNLTFLFSSKMNQTWDDTKFKVGEGGIYDKQGKFYGHGLGRSGELIVLFYYSWWKYDINACLYIKPKNQKNT